MARPNYKMSFLCQKKTDGRIYHPEGIACPSPPTIGSLIFLFSGMHGSFPVEKKSLDAGGNFFFCGGEGGGGGGCSFQPSPLLKIPEYSPPS